MWVSRLTALLAVIVVIACGAQEQQPEKSGARFDPSKSDPEAIRIADQVLLALGGKSNWDMARYLSFRFVVEEGERDLVNRYHAWDRWTGRYRYEDTDRAGHHRLVLFNLNTKKGLAYVDSQPLEGDTLAALIDQAYARHINDTYWLLMPYKMKDPGVILKYEGTTEINGFVHDIVRLSFENVGLTPGDVYWAYFDQASRRMNKWEYLLQGRSGPRRVAWWSGWKEYWKIKLAEVREFENSNRRIVFRDILVSPTVDETVFESAQVVK